MQLCKSLGTFVTQYVQFTWATLRKINMLHECHIVSVRLTCFALHTGVAGQAEAVVRVDALGTQRAMLTRRALTFIDV